MGKVLRTGMLAGGLVLLLTAIAFAANGPAKLRGHRVYGGSTAKMDGFVDLQTGGPLVVLGSAANTAPELRHSNINLGCSNHAQVNTGMVMIHLKLRHGRYRFAVHFVRNGVKETFPGHVSVKLTIDISGTVTNSSTIAGRIKVAGPQGCSLPAQAYTARLAPPKP